VVDRTPGVAFTEGCIEGLVIQSLVCHTDQRGSLVEVFREDEQIGGHRPAMGYLSWTKPGVVRGPHEHVEQSDYFVFAGPSDFRLVCWDNRPHSPTYGKRFEVRVGQSHPSVVRVPPGVVHAYENVGQEDGLVLNFPDQLYAGRGRREAVDEIRWEEVPNNPFRF